jgi:2-keto-4-pentenoate hydratase
MRRSLAALLAAPAMAWALAPSHAAAACPELPEVARLAGAIIERREPPPPRADLTLADALCARERLVAVLAQPWGDQSGWKVASGGTEGAPPLYGALFFATLRERSGETFLTGASLVQPARFGIVPMLAPALLLRIRDEGVNEAGGDQLAQLRHIEAVLPFIELQDRVYGLDAPWSPALLLSINLGTRLGAMGEPIPVTASLEFARALGTASVTLTADEREVSRGTGRAAVGGHPLAALAWLVAELKQQGRRLRGGEHVAISLAPAVPAGTGRIYAMTLAGLAAGPATVGVRLQ